MGPIEIIRKIIGIYTLLVLIIGTLTNLLTFITCIKLRKSNTIFLFMMFFALSNIASLYWFNLNHFVEEHLGYTIHATNLIICKLGCLMHFSSLQIAAWLLVNIIFFFNSI